MRTLNLGIVAHVDAGKTSLTERILFEAGVLDEPGTVDAGNTHTDTMALERRRGITIRSAVVSFVVDDVTVNLIDTPGHADFIAEVERALAVLDGAILVVSAVEGVQAQTLVLFRALQRLGIPTLFFVNKVDRAGARPDGVLGEIAARLGPVVGLGTVAAPGTRDVSVREIHGDDPGLVTRLTEVLAEHDAEVMESYVGGDGAWALPDLMSRLADQTRRGLVHPAFYGSAITGAGVPALMRALTTLLPAVAGDPDQDASGVVFKIERGPGGEKIVYLRLGTGTVRIRDRLDLGHGHRERVTSIKVFGPGEPAPADALRAGQIGQLRGLDLARVGDVVGTWGASGSTAQFTRPSLETVVDPVVTGARGALHAALAKLAEQDPLIDVRQDDSRQQIAVSLYGEVQKEVIGSLLATEYGVDVTFKESTTLCIERVNGTAAAVERIAVAPNPFLATVGLRVEPAPIGAGVGFRLDVELGSMPPAFFAAVEEAVRSTLTQGPHGWDVPDCTVVMTRSGYWARQSHSHGTFDKSMSSTAGDFRSLAPLVLMEALRSAGTTVCEPIHRFDLELPEDAYAVVLATLPKVHATPLETAQRGDMLVLRGDVPAAWVHQLHQRVPDLTRGEGLLTTDLDHFRPVIGTPPSRARSDDDPTDPVNYLKVVARRAGRR
ncbi:MAG: GTP-binding protein [Nocardioidaceae bacterium]